MKLKINLRRILLMPIISLLVFMNSFLVKAHGEFGPDQGFLGQGVDHLRNRFLSSCLIGDVRYAGNNTNSITLERINSYEQLKTELSIQVGGKLSLEVIKASGATRFAIESSSNELSKTLIFKSVVRGKKATLQNRKIHPLINEYVKASKFEDVARACGEYFVHQIELGAQLFYVVKFSFSSKELKTKFEAEIDLDFVDLFEVQGASKIAFEKYGENVSLSLSAFQQGGNPGELFKILSSSGNNEVPLLKCGLKNSEACTDALELMIKYAETDFRNQIKDFKYDETNPNGPAFLSYAYSSYYEGGHPEISNVPPVLVSQEVESTRQRLLSQYERYRIDRAKSEEILGLRLSKNEKTVINGIRDRIQRNIAKAFDLTKLCYQTPADCVETYSAAKWEDYDMELVAKEMNFYDYCVLPEKSIALQRTINSIISFLGHDRNESCLTLENDLLTVSQLDLSGQQLIDLSPLRGLSQLISLKLENNKIVNLDFLNGMSQLRELKLRGNKIGMVSVISQLKNLEHLDLAYNKVVDPRPIATLTNLNSLKLQGNPLRFTNIAMASSLKPLVNLFYTENEVCQAERVLVFNHHLIAEDELEFYSKKNFAPYYRNHYARENGDIWSWVTCSEAAPHLQ